MGRKHCLMSITQDTHCGSVPNSTILIFFWRLTFFGRLDCFDLRRTRQSLTTTGETFWLYAWGSPNTFEQHTVRDAIALSLDSCIFRDANNTGNAKQHAHAW